MTLIISIIAVVLLVALGSKIFLKGSARAKPSGSDAMSSDPGKGKNKETAPAVKKDMKVFSGVEAKGANLFRLPPEPRLFTGRKETLKQIIAQTTTRPIIIGISGFSGVGKTCLIIPLSKMFAPQFPGECLFVDMQGDHPNPPSAEDIMRRIILKFHPTQPLPADEKKLATLYRVALKKHKRILNLDNASDNKQVKPLIPPVFWLLIVTSTKPVVIPKIVSLRLDPMEILEAHTLLTRWAPDISPALKEISLICQGIPLALEIIGKLFSINATMAPDYFAKKLTEVRKGFGGEEDARGNLIDGLRAALSLSYKMLPDKTALVLRKLYVFPESFTADAVIFICEDPKGLSLTGLEKFGLVQHNANTNRFSLHHQVRKFIKPLLKAGERGVTEKRLATEYMNVLETAHFHLEKGGKDAIKGLRLFDLELANIQAGMEWSRKHCAKDKDAAGLCNAYTENGAAIIGQRLSPSECVQWFEAALSAASQLEDKEAERKHLLNLGQQYVLLNRLQEATDTLQRAFSSCKKEGDTEGQKIALQQLGKISMVNNDYPLATKYMEENLELARSSGDEEEEFKLLAQLTKLCMQNQEYNKAVHIGEQAMELAAQNADAALEIALLRDLGKGYLQTGEAEKALKKFEEGLELSQKTTNSPLQGELFLQVGEAIFKTGDIPAALKSLKKGLEAVRKSKDLFAKESLLTRLAEIHLQSQGEEQATNYFEEALRLSQKTKDRRMEARVSWRWSQALWESGNLDEAIGRGQKALKIYEDLKSPEANEIRGQIEKWSVKD